MKYSKGDWTNCRYDICEIVDEDDEVFVTVATDDVDKVLKVLEENEQLKETKDYYYETYLEMKTERNTVRKENNHLKSRCDDYDLALKTLQDLCDMKLNQNNELKSQLDFLQSENEQLKHQLENGLCHMCGARLKLGGIDMPKGDVE